jgi:hypothetical protein
MAKRAEALPAGEDEPAAPTQAQAQGELTTAISRNVMTALGRPDHFLRVTVRQVTRDAYRVNVMTGADAASGRIAHSYFVTADKDGNVTASAPAIVKVY